MRGAVSIGLIVAKFQPSLRGAKRRSNPAFLPVARWIASSEFIIGRAFARPVGSQ
jgi:hypothetical protein